MTIYVSDKLQATAATVSGDPTPTTSWQWLRNSSAISGATSSDYVVSADDVDANISVIQSAINMLGTATATSASDGPVQAFTPSLLFRGSTAGTWYEPSDINRYTAPLGPELVTNGDFSNGTAGWTAPIASVSAISGVLRITATSDGYANVNQGFSTVAGKTYKVSCTLVSSSAAKSISVYAGTNAFTGNLATVVLGAAQNTQTAVFTATSATSYLFFQSSSGNLVAGDYYEIDNISVRELIDIDTATLYRDAAGTLPVTAVEQPVGLMLDKSKGLVLGPDVCNNTLNADLGWTKVGSVYQFVNPGSGGRNLYRSDIIVITGVGYQIECDVVGAGFVARFGTSSKTLSEGHNKFTLFGNGTNAFEINGTNATSGSVANVSVKAVPGNHAFNSSGNSANFPVLSARYNLLTKTEQFDDAAWVASAVNITANALTAPDGTLTADMFTTTSVFNSFRLNSDVTVTPSTSYTLSFYVYRGSATDAKYSIYNTSAGADIVSATSFFSQTVSGAWSRVTLTFTAPAGCTAIRVFLLRDTGVLGSIYIWGADLRVSNDGVNLPAYQRVNTSTDYDTVGFKPYLRFNGTNQWLQTSSIDFSATDKMFVSAGVRKLSDAAAGVLTETGSSVSSDNGSFAVFAPSSAAPRYLFGSRGTTTQFAEYTNALVAAPITNILSGIGNISGDQSILRVNGTQVAISTADQGTGNYGNYPLYIGARGGSSLWFNGRLYSLIVAGKLANAVEITETEKYVNGKTAAY